MLSSKNEYDKMANIELEHWWYCALHQLVFFHIKNNCINKHIEIIDAGCGTGGFMIYLEKRGYSIPKGFDISVYAVEICQQRGLHAKRDNLLNLA